MRQERRRRRILCAFLLVAAAEASQRVQSQPRSTRKVADSASEDNDSSSWRSSSEWWKDPLAMFDDEEDALEMELDESPDEGDSEADLLIPSMEEEDESADSDQEELVLPFLDEDEGAEDSEGATPSKEDVSVAEVQSPDIVEQVAPIQESEEIPVKEDSGELTVSDAEDSSVQQEVEGSIDKSNPEEEEPPKDNKEEAISSEDRTNPEIDDAVEATLGAAEVATASQQPNVPVVSEAEKAETGVPETAVSDSKNLSASSNVDSDSPVSDENTESADVEDTVKVTSYRASVVNAVKADDAENSESTESNVTNPTAVASANSTSGKTAAGKWHDNRAVRLVSRLVSSIPPSDVAAIEIPEGLSSAMDEIPGERPVKSSNDMLLSSVLAVVPAGPIMQGVAALAIGKAVHRVVMAKRKKRLAAKEAALAEEKDEEEEYEGVGYPMDSDNGSYLSESEDELSEAAGQSNSEKSPVEEELDDLGIPKPPTKLPFWRRKRSGPPAHQLVEQLKMARDKCRSVLEDKAAMEKLYETTSWQLKEAQTEVSALKQTTSYLQTQLRDQEDMVERVATAEQRKAREELARMKEAMVKVIKRERESMREEFLKQANELQSLWREEQDGKAPNYPWKRKNKTLDDEDDDDATEE